MGLKEFKVAPDNKGGRPPKEETEDEQDIREGTYGTAFVESEADKDWWKKMVRKYTDSFTFPDGSVEEVKPYFEALAHQTHLRTHKVIEELDKHGIYEMDWEEYREFYGEDILNAEVPGIKGPSSSSSSSKFSTSKDAGDGLSSIINAAK